MDERDALPAVSHVRRPALDDLHAPDRDALPLRIAEVDLLGNLQLAVIHDLCRYLAHAHPVGAVHVPLGVVGPARPLDHDRVSERAAERPLHQPQVRDPGDVAGQVEPALRVGDRDPVRIERWHCAVRCR